MDFRINDFYDSRIIVILLCVFQTKIHASVLKNEMHVQNPLESYDKFIKNLFYNATSQKSYMVPFHKLDLKGLSDQLPYFRRNNDLTTNEKQFTKLDPDATKDVGQLILDMGYPVEKYTIQTADGFLLGVFRIPHGKNDNPGGKITNATNPSPKSRPAVFLQHGLISSAADWVMNFERGSLGFILADAGYDVWMGNSRGNTYSRRHISLSPTEDAFWDWSFDEMAKFDTPACIDFILNKTGTPTISYIGHSQGTMMAFAMFSTLPEYEKKVNLFIGLAPIISLEYMVSPLKYLSLFPDSLTYTFLGRKDFLPNDIFIKALVDTVCVFPITNQVCDNLLFLICGPDISNLNTTRVPVYLNHTPAGASVKDIAHFGQMVREKRFAMYDYGNAAENTAHYGQPIPPAYDASKITVPSVLFTGENDWLADTKDVAILKNTLKTIKASYNIPSWNHLDFVYGIDAATVCYNPIVKYLDSVLK